MMGRQSTANKVREFLAQNKDVVKKLEDLEDNDRANVISAVNESIKSMRGVTPAKMRLEFLRYIEMATNE